MSVLRPRAGYVLILPESDQDRTDSGLILFSAGMRRKRSSGLVLLHQMSFWWETHVPEGLLDGEHVLFEKWAWKEFVLGTHELWLVPERAIFATVDTQNQELLMKRNELIEDLKMQVESVVESIIPTDSEEITYDQCEEIDGLLEGAAQATLSATEDEDDEDDEEDEPEEQESDKENA